MSRSLLEELTLEKRQMKIPHPLPYQGSKRGLATAILAYFPKQMGRLIEPFAGSAALTLAAASKDVASGFVINDLNEPLMDLWRAIIHSPERLARQYELLWKTQHIKDPRRFYDSVRDEFNRAGQPEHLLYLLARCVKASVRYNASGEFNQSPDNRRLGALPATLRDHIFGASRLLKGRTECRCHDYKEVLADATAQDVIYMDPPYQGVCANRDPRYLKSILFDEFVVELDSLNSRNMSYLVSYDGRTGEKTHGRRLPPRLGLRLVELHAGRSSQATLLGRAEVTVESLYLSHALVERLSPSCHRSRRATTGQLVFSEESQISWLKTKMAEAA